MNPSRKIASTSARSPRASRCGLTAAALLMLACASCNDLSSKLRTTLVPPDSKVEAKGRWNQVRAKLKLQLANESYTGGQLDAAQKNLEEAIALDPTAGDGYVLQCKLLLAKGQTAAASAALDEALRRGADNAETDYLSGLISQRYDRFEDALSWYQRASQRDAMSAHYVAASAEMLVQLGRPSEALQLVRSRMTDFDQNATLRALAGGIHMMLGEYERAADAYRDASRISPGDGHLKAQLGVALTLAKNYEEAETVLVAATTSDEPQAGVLSALGRCRLALNRAEAAKADLRKATDADPANMQNWVLLAQAGVRSKDLLTARRAAGQAVQLAPNDCEARLLLGYVCYAQRDYPAAITALRQVVDASPNDTLAMRLLCQSHDAIGRPEEAKSLARRALTVNADCPWARERLESNRPLPPGSTPRGGKGGATP